MRELNQAEIESVCGGTYLVTTASKIQATTLLASYAHSIDFSNN